MSIFFIRCNFQYINVIQYLICRNKFVLLAALRVNGPPVPPLEHRLPHCLRAAPRRAPPAAGGLPLCWREGERRSVALRCARSVKRQPRLSPGAALTSVTSPVAVAPRSPCLWSSRLLVAVRLPLSLSEDDQSPCRAPSSSRVEGLSPGAALTSIASRRRRVALAPVAFAPRRVFPVAFAPPP